MDKIDKAIGKLTAKERERIKQILFLIQQRNFSGLDVKKLVGQQTVFRVRAGKYSIIFRLKADQELFILAVEKRSENTYRKF